MTMTSRAAWSPEDTTRLDVTDSRTFQCPHCGGHIDYGLTGLEWTINSPRDLADRIAPQLATLETMELWVASLNTRNRVIDWSQVARGGNATAAPGIGEILRTPVRYSASGLIVAENHPGGSVDPSPDDLDIQRTVLAGARLLDINLLDWLIVASSGQWVSLRDRGVSFDRPARAPA